MHTQVFNILQGLELWMSCLKVKFREGVNLLDVLMKHSTFIDCRLADELTEYEIAHKTDIHPFELSNFLKAKYFRI